MSGAFSFPGAEQDAFIDQLLQIAGGFGLGKHFLPFRFIFLTYFPKKLASAAE